MLNEKRAFFYILTHFTVSEYICFHIQQIFAVMCTLLNQNAKSVIVCPMHCIACLLYTSDAADE